MIATAEPAVTSASSTYPSETLTVVVIDTEELLLELTLESLLTLDSLLELTLASLLELTSTLLLELTLTSLLELTPTLLLELLELTLLTLLEILEILDTGVDEPLLPHPVIVNDAANIEAATTLMNCFLLAINVLFEDL